MDDREREIRTRLAAVPCGYAWLREDVAWLLAALDAARAERDAAVAAERERCAWVCERVDECCKARGDADGSAAALDCAAAIRRGGAT